MTFMTEFSRTQFLHNHRKYTHQKPEQNGLLRQISHGYNDPFLYIHVPEPPAGHHRDTPPQDVHRMVAGHIIYQFTLSVLDI